MSPTSFHCSTPLREDSAPAFRSRRGAGQCGVGAGDGRVTGTEVGLGVADGLAEGDGVGVDGGLKVGMGTVTPPADGVPFPGGTMM